MRVMTESGPLIAATVAVAMLIGVVAPASAQFFPFGGFQQQPPPRPRQNVPQPQYRSNNPFSDFFAPFQGQGGDPYQQQQQQQPAPRVDYSRAPPQKSEKGETAPERHVLVLGDAMADWLAYGLEDALSEQPDIGVTRKHKTVSGLIRYQPRGEPSDWTAAAKGIVAGEKADAIVVMLGLHDRTSITETAADRAAAAKRDERKKTDGARSEDTARPDAEASPDDSASNDNPDSIVAPERGARSAGSQEFRSERWIELYKKKIEDMIAVARTKNVPVLWVGLPALRGQKSTSDALFLNSLYREVATRAGITYVDVWDGFVDESGRFLQQGPDFEGQTRRLRTSDGVFFTRAGARKLAHYVDRELQRLLNRATPVALPADPGAAEPDTAPAQPGGPPPRPLAGPVVPLVAASINSSELMGGAGSKPAAVNPLAARTMVKGEALAPPGGRADDTSWPRRAIASINAPAEPMPTAANPNATPEAISAAAANVLAAPMPPAPPPAKRRPRPQPSADNRGFTDPFGSPFSTRRPPPAYSPQPQRPASPRPPAPVGRSAYAPAPGGFFSRW